MKRVLIIIISTFLLTAFITNINAQVTIGAGMEPITGALLDLKMNDSGSNNINATKGLCLPRVALIDLRDLYPTVENATAAQKEAHTGLLVFNMTVDESKYLKKGIYYWDGEKWGLISVLSDEEIIEPTKDPLGHANCYIVNPGNTQEIPVSKAFAFWEKYTTANFQNQSLSGPVTAELLWQDVSGLLNDATSSNGWALPIEGTGEDAVIKVSVANGKTGNAVVVVKVAGTVRWSWHIWATNYDPNDASGHKTNNGYTFMDRYLGAHADNIVVAAGHENYGMHYQWGRKDPFPGSASNLSNSEKTLYGQITQVQKIACSAINNLANSVHNPITYYTNSVGEKDWYTTSANDQHDDLWNKAGNKSVFDPCPDGWRVPAPESTHNDHWPWNGLTVYDFYSGNGINWDTAGIYHPAGCRRETGNFDYIGSRGCVWTAHPCESYLNYVSWQGFVKENDISRAFAYSVRCVKE